MATQVVEPGPPAQAPWWLVLMEGIALVLLGLMLLLNTGETTIVIVTFIGIYWLLAGIFRIMNIFIDTHLWGWNLIMGLLGIAAGLIVVQYPLWSTGVIGNTVIIVLGFMGIAFGFGNLFGGIRGRNLGTALLGVCLPSPYRTPWPSSR
jgi:uncharacterized membrane protein HdeD (DUF308 family)